MSQDAKILSTSACAALGVRICSEVVNTHIQGVIGRYQNMLHYTIFADEIQKLFPLMAKHSKHVQNSKLLIHQPLPAAKNRLLSSTGHQDTQRKHRRWHLYPRRSSPSSACKTLTWTTEDTTVLGSASLSIEYMCIQYDELKDIICLFYVSVYVFRFKMLWINNLYLCLFCA